MTCGAVSTEAFDHAAATGEPLPLVPVEGDAVRRPASSRVITLGYSRLDQRQPSRVCSMSRTEF